MVLFSSVIFPLAGASISPRPESRAVVGVAQVSPVRIKPGGAVDQDEALGTCHRAPAPDRVWLAAFGDILQLNLSLVGGLGTARATRRLC